MGPEGKSTSAATFPPPAAPMGLVGYADCFAIPAGGIVSFMVSGKPGTVAELVRFTAPAGSDVGWGVERVEAAIEQLGELRHQDLCTGSYAEVADLDGRLAGREGLELSGWVYPTAPRGLEQALLSRLGSEGGWALVLTPDHGLEVRLEGDGGTYALACGAPLDPWRWYRFNATLDADGSVAVEQEQIEAPSLPGRTQRAKGKASCGRLPRGSERLLIAAAEQRAGRPGLFLDGKLDTPRIGPAAAGDGRALAEWDFGRDFDALRVPDISGNGFDARLINMPARAVTGRAWSGDSQRFTEAPAEYAAVQFHSDDLEDARWEPSYRLRVPSDLPSGVYALRLRDGGEEDHVPFAVTPGPTGAAAPVVVVLPAYSYLAYANEHVADEPVIEAHLGRRIPSPQPEDAYVLANRLSSLYDRHTDGSGTFYSSRLRPIVNMRPGYLMPTLGYGVGGPHGFPADLFLIAWLEREGIAFDVITDEQLHEDAAALAPYRVAITGSHPEYCTAQMLVGLEAYLSCGGRVMYLGGNGFECVTSVHPECPHVIEIRRSPEYSPTWRNLPGETYHSTSGEPGGLWRHRGRAPHRLFGVGTTATTWRGAAPYRRTDQSFAAGLEFVFDGIATDEGVFGDFGLVLGGAASMEIDGADPRFGTPPGTILLARATAFPPDYLPWEAEEHAMPLDGEVLGPPVRADMVLVEHENGGCAYSVGSIGWSGALPVAGFENPIAKLTSNVLRRLLDPEPLGLEAS